MADDHDQRGTSASRRDRLQSARIYLCTDGRLDRRDLEVFLTEVIEGGVDIVQLRQKGLEARDELDLLARMRAVVEPRGVLLAVNDRADVARIAGADILHLGQRDLAPAEARALVGPDILIGRSTHDEQQGAEAAADPDVDYYCVGPVWETPTKPGRPAAGPEALRAAADRGAVDGQPPKPWFAIGGIESPERLEDVVARGADRVVVVRALTQARDPREAARTLRARLPA